MRRGKTAAALLALTLVLGPGLLFLSRPDAGGGPVPRAGTEASALSENESLSEAPASPSPGTASPAPVSSPPAADGPAEPEAAELEALLAEQVSGLEGAWDVYVLRLSDGAACRVTAGKDPPGPMVAASLIKLFIMGAVCEQVRDGALEGEDVEDALERMITVSDNDAANDLTRLLGGGDAAAGMDTVNRFAESAGCGDTRMNRLMLADNGLQNYTTAADCGTLLRLIYEGACVSSDLDKDMLALLLAQTRRGKIPAGLPEGAVCANKTGELTGLSEGDAAIVFGPEGDYILCVLSEPADNAAAIAGIRALSASVYAFFEGAACQGTS